MRKTSDVMPEGRALEKMIERVNRLTKICHNSTYFYMQQNFTNDNLLLTFNCSAVLESS